MACKSKTDRRGFLCRLGALTIFGRLRFIGTVEKPLELADTHAGYTCTDPLAAQTFEWTGQVNIHPGAFDAFGLAMEDFEQRPSFPTRSTKFVKRA